MTTRTLGLAACLAASHAAIAQEVRGTVRDSATRVPIPGAVVVLLDSGGATLGRNITNERGEYRVAATPAMRRMQLRRLGFRAREVLVPRTGDVTQLDVALTSLPTLLEGVQVLAGASCPRRSDRGAALALLEQARAGLLTAVVAREANPATMVRIGFERTMDGTSDRIERQTVRLDSGGGITKSFQAVRSAREFVRLGFAADSANSQIFYGPDAETLLDDGFAAGYCFHIRNPDADRPKQVGLAFGPAARQRPRIDIDGTLWVDTAARSLRDIEFRYLGLPSASEVVRPRGQIVFREMANGVVFIDRWFFSLPGVGYDTSYGGPDLRQIIRTWFYARESGGEVATSSWPDGHSWNNALGEVRVRAVDLEGRGVTGAAVRLVDTDYLASPDVWGDFEIKNLLPGPYTVSVILPELASLGITLPTALRFTAARDSIIRTRMLVPSAGDYVVPRCAGTAATEEPVPMLTVIVTDEQGAPVGGALWEVSKDNGVPWQRITERRSTSADGRIRSCLKLEEGDKLEIRAWRRGEAPRVVIVPIRKQGAAVQIQLPPRP